MKKTIALALLLVMMTTVTCAFAAPQTIDLETMTFEELADLKSSIDYAIWNSKDWQEVTVPQGIYEIGVDIPAGHWTILAADGSWTHAVWGRDLDHSKTKISSRYAYAIIMSKSISSYNPKSDITHISWELTESSYLSIDSGVAVFVPYVGKPSLSFK